MQKIILYLLLLCSINLNSQNLLLNSILPSRLNEVSGIVKQNSNAFWVHNDSGDLPVIFKIDSSGNIIDSVFLDSVTHTDFEDITKDNSNNLYIGDFGNNNHNRTNLVIYKIPTPTNTNDTIVPQKITFNYSDQSVFPDPDQNTDCEAIIFKNGKLYLFTKNHGSSGFCKLYELPSTPGDYTANLIDSISFSGMITGADITSSGKLVLLEMGRIHIFDNYAGNDFFGGTHTQWVINFSQKEGVCFKTDNNLFITQEDNTYFPSPKLFELDITNIASVVKISREITTTVFPNPTKDILNIKFNDIPWEAKKIKIKIIDNLGRTILTGKFPVQNNIFVPVYHLPKGNYYIQIKIKKLKITKPFVKN
jgi:hypothetical protein